LAAAWSFKQVDSLPPDWALDLGGDQSSLPVMPIAMMFPLVLTGVAFVALLGPEYRYNAFFATSLSRFEIRNFASMAFRVPLKGGVSLSSPRSPRLWLCREFAGCARMRSSVSRPAGGPAFWGPWSPVAEVAARSTTSLNSGPSLVFLAVIEAGWPHTSQPGESRRDSLRRSWHCRSRRWARADLNALRIALPGRLGTVRLREDEGRLLELKRAKALAEAEAGGRLLPAGALGARLGSSRSFVCV